MFDRFLGANSDARLVALARGVAIAAAIAAIGVAQHFLTDSEIQHFGWVPIAAWALRQLEGFLDHGDSTRPG